MFVGVIITSSNSCKKSKSYFEEKNLLNKIENGFKNHEFKMYLHFIVDNENKNLSSAETLSRWEFADNKVIFPGTYIGLMEKTGLIK